MVKRVLFIVGIMFLTCIVCSQFVYAQSTPKSPDAQYKQGYVVLKGGIFYPQGDLKDLSTGFNGEIALGYKFHPNAAIEFSGGYLETKETFRYVIRNTPVSEKFEVSAIPVTIAIKGILKPDKYVDIYGMLGVGAYFVHGKDTASGLALSSSISDSSTVFGGFVGAGISYDVNDNIFIGLEGKYHYTSETTLRDTFLGYEISQKFRVEGLVGTALLGFRF